MLVTTVATLAVAAAALLGPLQHELRNSAKTTLKKDLTGATSAFQTLDLAAASDFELPAGERKELAERIRSRILQLQHSLSDRVGATVTLLGYPDLTGHGYPVAPTQDADSSSDPYDDVASAFLNRKQLYSFGSINGTEYVRAALPFTRGGREYVLAVRKPIDTIRPAVHVVATAFLTAALVALALTLLLGIPLSATLVRRLRRLREAALTLAEGGPAVQVTVDRARDEVGDLSRTFATMQHRLQQQEQARRAFVATASHELRTPLASLDGMLELLDDDLRTGEPDLDDALSLLERARVQSRRLGRLAADLLDLSRLDAEVELRSEPVELSELSRAVLAEFELGTEEHHIFATLDDRNGSVWALADPGSVARIVRILLDNAVRVSPPGGQIAVELRAGASASLSVRDDGPGVPVHERELIFERFKRGTGAAGKAGFGLGLAIGRELAERMGGELVLDDRDPPGAKFTLRLPAAAASKEEPVAVV